MEYQPFQRKITYFAGKEQSVEAKRRSLKEQNTSCRCLFPRNILSRLQRSSSRHLASILMSMFMGTFAWTYYRFLLTLLVSLLHRNLTMLLNNKTLLICCRISGRLLMMLGLFCYRFRVCLEVCLLHYTISFYSHIILDF